MRKLDDIETLIANRPKPPALMGHNQLPETLADDDNALLDGNLPTPGVRNLKIPAFRAEAAGGDGCRATHDTANRASRSGYVMRWRGSLDLATDEFAKEIGKQAAETAPFWYGVSVALHQVLGWVGHWLNMIGWGRVTIRPRRRRLASSGEIEFHQAIGNGGFHRGSVTGSRERPRVWHSALVKVAAVSRQGIAALRRPRSPLVLPRFSISSAKSLTIRTTAGSRTPGLGVLIQPVVSSSRSREGGARTSGRVVRRLSA